MPARHLRPCFNEAKATQVAARFLLSEDRETELLKLVKLIYLADRKALVSHGRPITFDLFYSLPHGPIVSSTLNRMNWIPNEDDPGYWARFIGPRDPDYRLRLVEEPGFDQLSPAEEAIVDAVYGEVGHMDKWQIRNLTHQLPEYRNPGQRSRLPILYRHILSAEGWAPEDIEEVYAAIDAETLATRVLG